MAMYNLVTITIGLAALFLIINPALAWKYQFPVCANDQRGVYFMPSQTDFYAVSGFYGVPEEYWWLYRIRAEGTWRGKKNKNVFGADGSPQLPSEPHRLVAPHLPEGALIFHSIDNQYFLVGKNKDITIDKPGWFVHNDYKSAYGDNSDCLSVFIDTVFRPIPIKASSYLPDFEITKV